MLSASFVIPCKGRLAHLQETLDCKLNQVTDYPFDIIVVDYSCPDNTYNWVNGLKNDKVRAILVPAPKNYFNNSHCRNCGARRATGDVLIFSDADCMLHLNWLDYVLRIMELDPKVVGFGNDYKPGDQQRGRGTWAVRREVWERLRGYDEQMEGWGAEELDFFWRMQTFALSTDQIVYGFDRMWCRAIEHDDSLRTRFYEEQDKEVSNKRNFKHRVRRTGINISGFGNISKYTG